MTSTEQKAFEHALTKLRIAKPHERAHLLNPVQNPSFTRRHIQYTMRASQKYRMLVGRDGTDYVVRGFVSRGDKRFYKSE